MTQLCCLPCWIMTGVPANIEVSLTIVKDELHLFLFLLPALEYQLQSGDLRLLLRSRFSDLSLSPDRSDQTHRVGLKPLVVQHQEGSTQRTLSSPGQG